MTSSPGITLNKSSSVPIFTQIEEQIRLAVARRKMTPGQRIPTVRSLSRTLGVHVNTVSKAYGSLAREGVISTHYGGGTFIAEMAGGPRFKEEREARLSTIVSRALLEAASLGFSPEETEASFTLRLARWRQEQAATPRTKQPLARIGRGLVVMGSHDLALDLLASHLRRLSGVQMTSTHVGSLGGLIALARGEAHLAGCHLLDDESGQYNLPFVRRVLPGVACTIVRLVGRVQALLVAKGNPKDIRRLKELARPDVRMVNRQKGSGTRVLLDSLLRKDGIDHTQLRGYEVEMDTHTAVAAAVASGQADVGLGIPAAARALGLDCVPVHNEHYDLVVPRVNWDWAPVVVLRRILASNEFKDSVQELGGYDVTETGSIVVELS